MIKLKNITKKFNGFVAVNKVNLRIKKSEIFGLLGPNGAGKTTIISILSTLMKPTSGTAEINGYDILNEQEKVRKSIGIVFQESVLDSDLTAYDNLDFHASLYNIPKSKREKRIKEVVSLVGLSDFLYKKVYTFSGGMKRRLELARGFLHSPKVLFLDEPTLGLDPQTRRHVWDYILNLKTKEKVTILLTTHYLEEADVICDRIAIIDKGKIVVVGEPQKLKNRIKGDIIKIKVKTISEFLIKDLKNIRSIKDMKTSRNEMSILIKNAESKIAEIIDILKKHTKIETISVNKPTLEDVFLYYTGRGMRDAAY
ncbi:MAG: ATP-binding cassette domain-containing protein [Candidatus Woesearchaeota archaeon]